jgi:hypothetical protein
VVAALATLYEWNICAVELARNRTPLVMLIRAYLDGQTFDGETIRLMGIAFEMALASFGGTPGCDDPVRAALAHNIIALAKGGDRNPERLCEGALKALNPPDPLLGSPPPAELPEGGQADEG